jgi:hypothetical protein
VWSRERGHTVEWIPEEDFACEEATADFVDPGIIECHPGWLGRAKSRRLNVVPEARLLDVLAAGDMSVSGKSIGMKSLQGNWVP